MQDVVFFFSEHLILSAFWFFFLISSLFLIIKSISLKDKFIGNIQAIKLINQKNAVVIDTRSEEIFKRGYIVNSIHFPLKNILLGNLKEIEAYKAFPIILILSDMNECTNCMKEFLKYGFNNVYFLNNGIYCWTLDNLPLITKDK